jgi:hypothetical protein
MKPTRVWFPTTELLSSKMELLVVYESGLWQLGYALSNIVGDKFEPTLFSDWHKCDKKTKQKTDTYTIEIHTQNSYTELRMRSLIWRAYPIVRYSVRMDWFYCMETGSILNKPDWLTKIIQKLMTIWKLYIINCKSYLNGVTIVFVVHGQSLHKKIHK